MTLETMDGNAVDRKTSPCIKVYATFLVWYLHTGELTGVQVNWKQAYVV